MTSTATSNPVSNSERARESRRRQKKKMKTQPMKHQRIQNPSTNQFSWKSDKTEQTYSFQLFETLRKVSLNPPPTSSSSPSFTSSSSSSSAPRRGRAVRKAADRALADAARGRTRWSRAILMTSRLKLKFMKRKRQKGLAAVSGGGGAGRPRKRRLGISRLKKGNGKNPPAVQRKVRVLGRLVPGCRKEPLPVILEEATDYIEALEMQIRAMTALLNRSVVSAGSGGGGGSALTAAGQHLLEI